MPSMNLCHGSKPNNILTLQKSKRMQIQIKKDGFIHLSQDQIVMGFVASCIEDVANHMGVSHADMYQRMSAIGMIDQYLIPCYNTLHTESRENLTSSLIETLTRWEADAQ